jgi:hypothetical protein
MIAALVGLLLAVGSQPTGIAKAGCFTALLKLPAPTGYRYPVESDVSDYWQYYRDEHNREASCKNADLNEDGVGDYVSFAIRTVGPGFAVVFLYSGKNQYEPRIVWTDSGQVYRAVDGRVEITGRGRHAKYFGCDGGNQVDVTLPMTAVDYFTRPPASVEGPGRRTKPEHRLIWWPDEGLTPSQRDLCTTEGWTRYRRLGR